MTTKLITRWKSLIWKKPKKKYSLKYLGHQQWLELAYTCLGNLGPSISATIVSYPMLRMTHPSRNFFVLCLCMFVWLRRQGFESSVNKVFQTEKLINSKTMKRFTVLKRKLVQQELTWYLVQLQPSKKKLKNIIIIANNSLKDTCSTHRSKKLDSI